jgi:putative aldouronate transport system substrate-binding protein
MDYYPMTAEQTETAQEIQITVNNYVSEMTAAFLTGQKSIDDEWDNYLAQLEVIGLDTLQGIYQSAYSLVH